MSSISHFPETVSSDLIRLADWLISQSRDEYMNIYARVRANTLTKSMTTLKEYQKTGSAGSSNMAIGQTLNSPLVVCLCCFIYRTDGVFHMLLKLYCSFIVLET